MRGRTATSTEAASFIVNEVLLNWSLVQQPCDLRRESWFELWVAREPLTRFHVGRIDVRHVARETLTHDANRACELDEVGERPRCHLMHDAAPMNLDGLLHGTQIRSDLFVQPTAHHVL